MREYVETRFRFPPGQLREGMSMIETMWHIQRDDEGQPMARGQDPGEDCRRHLPGNLERQYLALLAAGFSFQMDTARRRGGR